MFLTLFTELRDARVPVTLKEYLTLLEAVGEGVAEMNVDTFYYLSRACLVKDERNLDKFDRVFGKVFEGVLSEQDVLADMVKAAIPEEWLRRLAEKHLTPEEMEQVKSMGGFEKLMETLRKRLEEQKERHQGGSKWIGTAGTSPFGAYGYNPEGVRIGQNESRHRRAVKVWDKREYRNLDDGLELGTRNFRIALRRLRKFAREGAATELDLPGTIRSTARQGGWLDVQMVPERHNKVKVLLLLDAGGSMDDHVRECEELFSAVRSEFKHLEHYYFHNCPYGGLWKDNRRRHADVTPTWDVINTYGPDYKLIFVGDAAMSPYEITTPGGAVEEWNEEPGHVWMQRLLEQWPSAAWLNPVPQSRWQWSHSTAILEKLMNGRMYPMTLEGLDLATRDLNKGGASRTR